MGLNGVHCVAVLLTWSLLFRSLVQGHEWTVLSEDQVKDLLRRPLPDQLPDKPDDPSPEIQAKPHIKFDDIAVGGDYDSYDYDPPDEKSFFSKGEGDKDWNLTPNFFEPDLFAGSIPDPYDVSQNNDTEAPTELRYVCLKKAFKVFLFEEDLDSFKIIRQEVVLKIDGYPKSCGFVNRRKGTLIVPFKGCFATHEKREDEDVYSLQLRLAGETPIQSAVCRVQKSVQTELSPRGVPSLTVLNCPFTSESPTIGPPTMPTYGPPTMPTYGPPTMPTYGPPTMPTFGPPTLPTIGPPPTPLDPQLPTISQSPIPLTQSCSSSPAERLPCGFNGITPSDCEDRGCCVCPTSQFCFYPENECTVDGYFVFTIRHDSAPLPLDPATLEIPGTNCRPLVVTSTFAIFKFHRDDCGTVSYSVGETTVYLAEVVTAVEILHLKYGAISRSNQLRFLIECRYSSGAQSLASAGYMVKTPTSTLPSHVIFQGLYGIELRIATDATFTDFYPTYHPPLSMLLGKPVYLQLVLLSPAPDAVILVNYCVAYPRFAKRALVLIYEGCPNPNDPRVFVFRNSDFNEKRNKRQFSVDVFQFMQLNSNKYIDEDIYFMCSSRLCFSFDEPCEERCFDGSVPQTI